MGVEAELGQAGGFEAAGLPFLKLAVGAAAPQGEGLGEGVRGAVGFAEGEELVAAVGERLELAGVDRVGREGEPVPVTGGGDGVGAECLAEPDDARLEVLVPGGRWLIPPDRLGELVGGSASSPAAVRAARTSVSRGLRRGAESSSVSGPRTWIPTFRMSSRPVGVVNRGCTRSVPVRRGVSTGGWQNWGCPGRRVPAEPQENVMNRNRNIQQHPTRTDQYALAGPRWWWTPAAGGAAAAMAVVAIVGTSSAGHAIPVDVDRYATTPASQLAPARPALAAAQDSPDIPDGYRQCFMWQSHWNTALDGAQPFAPRTPTGTRGTRATSARPGVRPRGPTRRRRRRWTS